MSKKTVFFKSHYDMKGFAFKICHKVVLCLSTLFVMSYKRISVCFHPMVLSHNRPLNNDRLLATLINNEQLLNIYSVKEGPV